MFAIKNGFVYNKIVKKDQTCVQKRTILLCSFNEETNKESDVRIITGSNKVIREWSGTVLEIYI